MRTHFKLPSVRWNNVSIYIYIYIYIYIERERERERDRGREIESMGGRVGEQRERDS